MCMHISLNCPCPIELKPTLRETMEAIEPSYLLKLIEGINGDPYYKAEIVLIALHMQAEVTPPSGVDLDLERLGELGNRLIHMITLENMRREGMVEIMQWPNSIFDVATDLILKKTDKGNKRHAELKAKLEKGS
jgi:hypothetical protein